MNTVEAIDDRIHLAREHIAVWQDEIDSFTNNGVYPMSFNPQGESDWATLILAQVLPEPIIRWGIRIGEITHVLCSALDHVAFRLTAAGKAHRQLRFHSEATGVGGSFRVPWRNVSSRVPPLSACGASPNRRGPERLSARRSHFVAGRTENRCGFSRSCGTLTRIAPPTWLASSPMLSELRRSIRPASLPTDCGLRAVVSPKGGGFAPDVLPAEAKEHSATRTEAAHVDEVSP